MSHNKVQFIYASFFLVTIFTVISSYPNNPQGTSGVKARLERQSCACGKYCSLKACYVKVISRDEATTTMIFDLQTELKSVTLKVQTFFKYSNNEYKPFLVKTEIDVCAVQDGYYSSPGLTFLKNLLGNNSNLLNQKCPYQVREYYFNGIHFQASHLPTILPHGQYILNITACTQNNELVFNTAIYFYVINFGLQDLTIG